MVWCKIYGWLGFDFIMPSTLTQHYVLHRGLFTGKKVKQARLIIWYTTVWSIWLLRNEVIFRNVSIDFVGLIDIIKVRSWSWFSAFSGGGFSFSDWCSAFMCVRGMTWLHWCVLKEWLDFWCAIADFITCCYRTGIYWVKLKHILLM